MAKLHVRHGRRPSPEVANELICRFEFPERPGALMTFLDKLGGRWNISLFHYRNHGADFGRVLAGFEVPPEDASAFQSFLDALGYRYQREHDNSAYDLFSRGTPAPTAASRARRTWGYSPPVLALVDEQRIEIGRDRSDRASVSDTLSGSNK